LSIIAVKILALADVHSHTGGAGMIEFWRKLWQLTRPYKGRFILGGLFGILSGFADTVVALTLVFVVTMVFSGSTNDEINQAIVKVNECSNFKIGWPPMCPIQNLIWSWW
jgi:hypothetical protein